MLYDVALCCMMLHYVPNNLTSVKLSWNIYSYFDRMAASILCCTNNVVVVWPLNANSRPYLQQ